MLSEFTVLMLRLGVAAAVIWLIGWLAAWSWRGGRTAIVSESTTYLREYSTQMPAVRRDCNALIINDAPPIDRIPPTRTKAES
jgi:hypothetical protein